MLCKSCGAKLNNDSAVCPDCHEDNRSSFELFCNNGELLLGILPGAFSGDDLSEPLSSDGPRGGIRASGLRGASSFSGEKGAFIIRSPETEQRKTRTADPEERPRGRFKPLTPGKNGALTSGRLKARSGKNRKSALPEAVFATPEGVNGKSVEDDVSKLKVSRTLNRTGRYYHPKAPDDAGLSFPPSADKEFPKTVYNGDLRPPEDSSGGFWPVFILLSVVLAAGAGLLYYTEEGRKILYSYVLTEPHPIAKDLPRSGEYSESSGNRSSLNAGNHGRRSGRHSQKEQPPETKPASSEKPVIAVVPPDSASGSLKDNTKFSQDSGTGKTDKPDKPAEGTTSPVTAPRPIISVPAEAPQDKTELAVIPAAPVTAGASGESTPPVIAPRPIISAPAELPPEKTVIASRPAVTDTAGTSGESAPPVMAPRPIISTPPDAAPEKTETAVRPQVPDTAEKAETASSVTAPRPIISAPAEVPDKHSGDLASASPKTPENKDTAKAEPKKTEAPGSGASPASGRAAPKPAGSNAASGRKPAGSQPAKPGRKSDKPRGRNKPPRKNSRRK